MYYKLLALLAARGKTATDRDLLVQDSGNGPVIAVWNVAALGALPTPSEIAAVTPTDEDAARRDALAAHADTDLVLQAVAQTLWEEIQKCQVQAGQTLRTRPQTLARVKATYRGLL